MKLKYIIVAIITSLSFTSCMDMDIDNMNNPDTDLVLGDGDAVKALTGGLFKTWFGALHDNYWALDKRTETPGHVLWYLSDNGTTSWANHGAYDLGMEPRVAYNNTPTYSRRELTESYYKNVASVATSAVDVLTAIEGGVEIGKNGEETQMVRAFAKFVQGISNGYLGLMFDKSFPVRTKEDFDNLEFVSYQEMLNIGVSQLEEVVAICESNQFVLPEVWIPGANYSNVELGELANSFIARLLVYGPRNKAQDDATDWAKVLMHAEKGIQQDLAPISDGNWGSWRSQYINNTVRDGWGKIDMRIINMMDPNMPATFPESGDISELPNNGLATSDDARLLTDFSYDDKNDKPERGYYRWSSYRYKRLDNIAVSDYGPGEAITEFRKAENDLFIAEAKLRNGDIAGAADIVNAGTRVTRGELPEVAVEEQVVKEAIWYERNIELVLLGVGVNFFDMRRNDLLQQGTLLHFPFPAQQLQLLGLPFYTFGGTEGVPGEDYSIGGWK
ncbi:MAG: RagB/SusD family nutrient uptake outer membrane protein [Bacteroidota bacterium]